MSTFDLAFLNDLLSQPERTSSPRKPKDVRDYDHWFAFQHNISGYCSNEECVAEVLQIVNQFLVPPRSTGRNRVTAEVNGYEMCRFCFLDGWHYTAP